MSEFRPDRIRRIEELACVRAAHRADALAAEGPTPCSSLVSDDVRATLADIDRAVASGDVRRALDHERLLPPSIGADPAIVDRLATLRLLEGDAVTALAALGAVARPTPRLDLLRAIALVALDDADGLALHLEELSDEPAARPLASILMAVLVAAGSPSNRDGSPHVAPLAAASGAQVESPKESPFDAPNGAHNGARHHYPDPRVGPDPTDLRHPRRHPLQATHHYRDQPDETGAALSRRTDPTPAFCAILTSAVAARHGGACARPLTVAGLGDAALHELSVLLAAFTAPVAAGSRHNALACRVFDSLEGLARDLGLTHATAHRAAASIKTESVAVRMSDRRHLPWRTARSQTRSAPPAVPPNSPASSTAIAA